MICDTGSIRQTRHERGIELGQNFKFGMGWVRSGYESCYIKLYVKIACRYIWMGWVMICKFSLGWAELDDQNVHGL